VTVTIDAYYDFRSPYAYFANYRIREGSFKLPMPAIWHWRPVSIDILLNLQAGRDAWADYADPLSAPKRAHLIADVRRTAAFYGAPLRAPKPSRPDPIPALCLAALLDPEAHDSFRNAVFDALWQEQRDIADTTVLASCLARAEGKPRLLDQAVSTESRTALADETKRAFANGVFGVPTFVQNEEVFFGNDRLEMLAWRVGRERA
jgi:2-hydroxychromene-2-carboxylate isomerase